MNQLRRFKSTNIPERRVQTPEHPPAPVIRVDDRQCISIRLSEEDWTDRTPPHRMIIHWPASLRSLTTQLKDPKEHKKEQAAELERLQMEISQQGLVPYGIAAQRRERLERLRREVDLDEGEEGHNPLIPNLLGSITELKSGINKKVTPCNFVNARQVLIFMQIYEGIKGRDKKRSLYRTDISPGFVRWFKQQKAALALSEEAYKLLDYEDETIHERWDDAESIVEEHNGVKTYFVKFPNISVPLYTWQAAGVSTLTAMTSMGLGAFVCDETGSGKTFTVVAWAHREGHQLIVCVPAGLVEGWVRKVKQIIPLEEGALDRRVYAVGKEYPLKASEYDIIVVSYAMLRKRGGWPLTKFIEDQNRVLVLDEGHFAKNYDSIRTSACLFMSQHAKATVVMTATPLKNRIFELHPLLRMTRRLWTQASQQDFVRLYEPEDARSEVADELKGFMLRRMNKDVWHNAPSYELGEAWVTLTNLDDYRRVERDFIRWLMEKGADPEKIAAAERGKVIVQLNKLRQLAAHGKIEQAAPLIEKVLDSGEQCVVFCAFQGPLDDIASRFRNKTGTNFKGSRWKGSGLITSAVSKVKRQKYIDDFQDGKIGVLCIGVTAGGLGIDLPIARFGFFLDLPWSPADLEQCTGRLVRLGQTRDCQFVKVLADRTIDQRMEALIHVKAEIFRDAIGDEGAVDRVTSGRDIRPSLVSELIMSYIRDPDL